MTGLNEAQAARAYRATIDDHDQTNHLLMHWRHMLFEGSDEAAEAARAKLVGHIADTHVRLRAAIKAGTIRTKVPTSGPATGPALWESVSRIQVAVPRDGAVREGNGLLFHRASSEEAYERQCAEAEEALLATVPEGKSGRVKRKVEPEGNRWLTDLILEIR